MTILNDSIADYLEYCKYRKRLDAKTLKAYRIDLEQYVNYLKKNLGILLQRQSGQIHYPSSQTI